MEAPSSTLGPIISKWVYYDPDPKAIGCKYKTTTDLKLSDLRGVGVEEMDKETEEEYAKINKYALGFIVPIDVKVRGAGGISAKTGERVPKKVRMNGIFIVEEEWRQHRKYEEMLRTKIKVGLYMNEEGEILKISLPKGPIKHNDGIVNSQPIIGYALCTFVDPKGNKIPPKYDTGHPTKVTSFNMVKLNAPTIISNITTLRPSTNPDDREAAQNRYNPNDHVYTFGGLIALPKQLAPYKHKPIIRWFVS